MSEDNIPNPAQTLADDFYATTPAENPTPPDTDPPANDPGSEGLLGNENETPDADATPDADPPDTGADAAGDTDAGDQVEEVELQTFEQLAEHLETDPEFLEGLTVTQKVNGEAVEVKIADALQNHRKGLAGDAYLADAKEKSKAMLADVKERQESINETAVVAATMLKTLETQFEQDIAGVDWAQLRADDPGAAALKMQEVEKRRGELAALKKSAADTYRQHVAKVKEDAKNAQLARMPEEREKLIEAIPDWADDKKASAEKGEVVQYMQDLGFSYEEIEQTSLNSLFLASMIKAKRYDTAKGKTNAIRKKVIKIPKTIKPGVKQKEPDKPKTDSTDRAEIMYG